MDNLVEETNNIQNKQECQTMEYDILFIRAVHVKLLKLKGNIMREHRKKHMYDSMEPVAKTRFLVDIKENIQLWILDKRKNYFPNPMRN